MSMLYSNYRGGYNANCQVVGTGNMNGFGISATIHEGELYETEGRGVVPL